MNEIQKSLNQFLAQLLERDGFARGRDAVMRRWNASGDICCAVAMKVFSGGSFATVEIGFVNRQILTWFGFSPTDSPLPSHGNGFGIFYRLQDLGAKDRFVFPPGGWRIETSQEADFFMTFLSRHLTQSLTPLYNRFSSLDGWADFFREETSRFPCGRGRAWTLLGYSLLASPNRSVAEIQAVIDEHARQDASKKVGNRVDIEIVKQRELLRARESKSRAQAGTK